MIDTLIKSLGSLLAPVLAGAGSLIALLFAKFLWNRKNTKIDRLEQSNRIHESIEKTHEQDVRTDTAVQQTINDLEDKVHGESPEQGAADVSGAINDYFSGVRK